MHIIITTTWNCRRLLPTFLDHHRALGFDLAMVMDFDSVDGTREILASSAYAGFVAVEPFPGIAGLDSSNLMLRAARARFPPSTLCLFCDPDEFLVLPHGRPIAGFDMADASALTLERYNVTGLRSKVLADPGQAHPLGSLNIRIVGRSIRSTAEKLSGVLASPWIFTSIAPKLITRLGDTVAIGDGDHHAVVTGSPLRPADPGAYLLHYPISTFAEFERRVESNRIDLAANDALSPIYGWHARRWIKLADEGRLWSEYIGQFLADDALPELLESRIVEIDNHLLEWQGDARPARLQSEPPRRPYMNLIGRSGDLPSPVGVAPRPVYIVLGMHRSGTSLCSSILHALGIDMTDERWSDRGNEHGHWERRAFADVHDAILAQLNRGYGAPNHDFPLPAGWARKPELRPHIDRLSDLLGAALARSRYVGLKDPRTARMFPIWAEILARQNLQPKFIICLRNPVHVAQSLKARDGLDTLVGEFRWLDYTADCFRYAADEPVHIINYEDWFSEPMATLDALQSFLGLDATYRQEDVRLAVEALIRPDANHAAADRIKPQLALVRHFYTLARQAAEAPENRQRVTAFVEDFASFRQLLLPFERKLDQMQATADGHARRAAQMEEQIVAHHDAVAARDADAASLRALVADRDRDIAERDARLQALSQRSTSEVDALRVLVDEKDRELAVLGAQLQEASRARVEKDREFGVLGEQLHDASRARAESDRELATLGAQLQEAFRARVDLEHRAAENRLSHSRSLSSLHVLRERSRAVGRRHGLTPAIQSIIDELFSESWYLEQNPDVRDADVPGLHHYVLHGSAEGRSPHPRWKNGG